MYSLLIKCPQGADLSEPYKTVYDPTSAGLGHVSPSHLSRAFFFSYFGFLSFSSSKTPLKLVSSFEP